MAYQLHARMTRTKQVRLDREDTAAPNYLQASLTARAFKSKFPLGASTWSTPIWAQV